MKHTLLALLLATLLQSTSVAGTRVLTFIHLPLTNLGTAEDSTIVTARIPILINAVPESVLESIAEPYQIPQSSAVNIPNSNLVALLHIGIAVQFVKDRNYKVTLNLADLQPSGPYDVTADQVIEATIKCLQATANEDTNIKSFDLLIEGGAKAGAKWIEYREHYDAKHQQ